jgi:hypothetical protein
VGLIRRDVTSSRGRYGLLLAAISASFFVQGVAAPGRWEQVALSVLLGITLLLALWVADVRPAVLRPIAVLVVGVVAASLAAALSGSVDPLATRLANLLLVVLAPPAVIVGVVRSLRYHGRVTLAEVFGVLCLYILLGMLFAGLYGVLDRVQGEFFANGASATIAHCLYFSFTTLTTTGYGDLTAATNLGHTLSNCEALIGQIYLVTIVAVIVSNLGRGREPAQ